MKTLSKETNNMKQTIINELKKAGIELTPAYETLPEIIQNSIDLVNAIGYENAIKQTCLGEPIKNIIKKLTA